MSGAINGLWINSNKTQDAKVNFDEHSGYPFKWEHLPVLENLTAMREWQEKYNAVSGPLQHADLPRGIFDDDPSERIRHLMPARFYLFRYPQNGGDRGREAPPTYKIILQFFYDALEELERRLNVEDPENKVTIITQRAWDNPSGRPTKSIFTFHGMRSSVLTMLHSEGVPIDILVKLAGHASVFMTLKYTKIDPAHISQTLTAARFSAMQKSQSEFPNFLRSASFEQAARLTARVSDDGLLQATGKFNEPGGWLRMDCGLCPNGGTLCHVGGPVLQRRVSDGKDKSVYGPVPGARRNCASCRFFLTGLPFLLPLVMHAHQKSEAACRCTRQADLVENEMNSAKSHRADLVAQDLPLLVELRQKIFMLEEKWLLAIDARDAAYHELGSLLVD